RWSSASVFTVRSCKPIHQRAIERWTGRTCRLPGRARMTGTCRSVTCAYPSRRSWRGGAGRLTLLFPRAVAAIHHRFSPGAGDPGVARGVNALLPLHEGIAEFHRSLRLDPQVVADRHGEPVGRQVGKSESEHDHGGQARSLSPCHDGESGYAAIVRGVDDVPDVVAGKRLPLAGPGGRTWCRSDQAPWVTGAEALLRNSFRISPKSRGDPDRRAATSKSRPPSGAV
ncbi:MAG: hypothetical protein K0Q72_1989, partial [Armatimonadetes bacterium]|nr:hypothetical protein [Armatimonadota bacterium]